MNPEALSGMTPAEKRALLRRLLSERVDAGRELRGGQRREADVFPLSHAQRALWFLQRLLPDTYAYNVAFSGRFSPPLDLDGFRSAMAKLVERHAALRTVFSEEDGQPVQRVLPMVEPRLRVVEASDFSESQLYAAVSAEYQTPFLLGEALATTTVYRRRGEDVVLINLHHLVFDAWSQQILFTELRTLYEAELRHTSAQLPPQQAEYREFVMAQAAALNGNHGQRLWDYWGAMLAASPQALNIRSALSRPPTLAMNGATVPFSLHSEASAALYALAKQQNTTLYTIMLAAMQVLLFQFGGETDITIGTPVSVRDRPEWSNVIGYFINMLPMRSTVDERESFVTHLAHARDVVLGALEHQEFPFSLMVDRLKMRRDPSRSPVFQAMLNVIVSPRTSELASLFTASRREVLKFGDSRLTSFVIPQQEGQFEIAIEVADSDGLLRGNLKYQTDVHTHETARRMADSFVAILEAIAMTPDICVGELSRLDRDDFDV